MAPRHVFDVDWYSVETVAVTCRIKKSVTHGPPNNFCQHPELL